MPQLQTDIRFQLQNVHNRIEMNRQLQKPQDGWIDLRDLFTGTRSRSINVAFKDSPPPVRFSETVTPPRKSEKSVKQLLYEVTKLENRDLFGRLNHERIIVQ